MPLYLTSTCRAVAEALDIYDRLKTKMRSPTVFIMTPYNLQVSGSETRAQLHFAAGANNYATLHVSQKYKLQYKLETSLQMRPTIPALSIQVSQHFSLFVFIVCPLLAFASCAKEITITQLQVLSIDAVQGSEADATVISLAKSRPPFSAFFEVGLAVRTSNEQEIQELQINLKSNNSSLLAG